MFIGLQFFLKYFVIHFLLENSNIYLKIERYNIYANNTAHQKKVAPRYVPPVVESIYVLQ